MEVAENRPRYTGAEVALQATLEDLHVRTAVEETMQSLLIDVEVASSLQKDLLYTYQETELQQRLDAAETALQETRALELQQRERRTTLADELVKELWKLSRDLGELQQWKQTHQPMMDEYDELVAKLLHAQDQIQILKESSTPEDAAVVSEDASELPVEQSFAKSQQDRDKPSEKIDSLAVIPDETAPSSTRFESAASETGAAEPVATGDAVASSMEDSARTDIEEPLVSLLPEQEEEQPLTLDTLDLAALTHVFEFLDALEILSTAQVNVTMYSRVDALFGFSAGEEMPAESEQLAPELEGVPKNALPAPHRSESAAPANVPEAAPSFSKATTSETVDSIALAKPATSTTVATTSSFSSPASAASRPGGIFSLLQARANRRRPPAPTTGKLSQPLSAAMADSMASKLTDAELGAIISMKENLLKREKEVIQLTNEKDELRGKLAGTEALKEFLVSKVREVEQALRKRQDDESKVTQQIASDQEVIAFLDGRVQELERDIRSLSEEKNSLAEELVKVKVQNDKKVSVLSDMLQFERERVTENEREWKATKKLLVKEIKSCRAQLVALQAERDGFREQNERLKRAVVSATSMANGGL